MYMMTMGLMPLGTIPAGALADVAGVPFVLALQGGLMVLIFSVLWLTKSKVKKLP